eukprot:Lankesteria_metandrocarpae@DN4392_c0_g1_i1.p1
MFSSLKRSEKSSTVKLKQDQQETAEVYAEFVKSFQVADDTEKPKTFLRGGVFDPNKPSIDSAAGNVPPSEVYKPSLPPKRTLWLPPQSESLLGKAPIANPPPTPTPTDAPRTTAGGLLSIGMSSAGTKGTREIDAFLEEIKQKQAVQEQRKLWKAVVEDTGTPMEEKEYARRQLETLEFRPIKGSIPGAFEAEETTNLYIGNLSPDVTEEFLCQQFGKFGTVNSVKIMYPRTEGEKVRGRHCGFVSFESRDMAEAAKSKLDGATYYGMVVRIGWGKAITKPGVQSGPGGVGLVPVPAITPPSILGGFSDIPPAPSPDGATPLIPSPEIVLIDESADIMVNVPSDPKLKALIDKLATYIAEDGHPFEQQIMERETDNERFNFLFDFNSEDHRYYRWRVFASAQGDTPKSWRLEPFQVFAGGLNWVPPEKCYFAEPRVEIGSRPVGGLSQMTRRREERGAQSGYVPLADDPRTELEHILRQLTRNRDSIHNGMVFCLDHSDSAEEVVDCIVQSLTLKETAHELKMARLWLLSDVLHNSSSSKQSAWTFRSVIEKLLPSVCYHFAKVHRSISGRLTAAQFKDQLLKVFAVWESWGVYDQRLLKGLEATFLFNDDIREEMLGSVVPPIKEGEHYDPEVDGELMDDFDILVRYPYWLREKFTFWYDLDLALLEKTCGQHGLPIRMGFELDVSHCNDEDESVHGGAHTRSKVSDARRRKVLLDRLIAAHVYERWKLQRDKSSWMTNIDSVSPTTLPGDLLMNRTSSEDPFTNGSSPSDDTRHSVIVLKPLISSDSIVVAAATAAELNHAAASDSESDTGGAHSRRSSSSSVSSGGLLFDKQEDPFFSKDGDEAIFEDLGEDSENLHGDTTDMSRDAAGGGVHNMSEESIKRREKLRQIEVDVMKLQVQLEKRGQPSEIIQLQCDTKRQQLLRELERKIMFEGVVNRSAEASSPPVAVPQRNKDSSSSIAARNRRNSDSPTAAAGSSSRGAADNPEVVSDGGRGSTPSMAAVNSGSSAVGRKRYSRSREDEWYSYNEESRRGDRTCAEPRLLLSAGGVAERPSEGAADGGGGVNRPVKKPQQSRLN